MNGDVLDGVLVVAVLLFAVSGYRQGFIVGVLSFAGFLGGGVLGAKYATALHDAIVPGWNPALFGIVVVFVAASIGQVLATLVASLLRARLSWRPARVVDAAGGAVVSALSVLLVAWLVGTAVAHSSVAVLARQVRNSTVLAAIDSAMPDGARTWFSSFRRLIDNSGFPQVFGAIGPERIVPVAPPNPQLAGSRAVRLAQPSVLKVLGVARSCSRQLEGSAFVYAPRRVMTNAHVVAGVDAPRLYTADGSRSYDTRVVVYDPEADVAVLYVPELDRPALAFDPGGSGGDSAIVVGYPQNGPFTATPARIRTVQRARGPDIYQREQVTRQIFSVYATVRPGNSGGPLLSPAGKVYGVVFAAAVDDPKTGYALTAREVAKDAAAGRGATGAVDTGPCD